MLCSARPSEGDNQEEIRGNASAVRAWADLAVSFAVTRILQSMSLETVISKQCGVTDLA